MKSEIIYSTEIGILLVQLNFNTWPSRPATSTYMVCWATFEKVRLCCDVMHQMFQALDALTTACLCFVFAAVVQSVVAHFINDCLQKKEENQRV